MSIFTERRTRVYELMEADGIGLVMFEDFEGRRDPAVRWLSGQPGDALLFLTFNREAFLVPWDLNIAQDRADVETLLPYTSFNRSAPRAMRVAAGMAKLPPGGRMEVPPSTSYPTFLSYLEALPEWDILCRAQGIHSMVETLRAIKDDREIQRYQEAAIITDRVIEALVEGITSRTLRSEIDVALCIETECRQRGAEGAGFPTLAAGPLRSYGIHAFPAYTSGPFGSPGLSIVDFGVQYRGYITDVTMTIARGRLNRAQERLLSLVERAYRLALDHCVPGAETRTIAREVDALFKGAKQVMPHALGHGIGLEAHEAPAINNRDTNEWVLQPGMVFTLEPGLYDPVLGGCRLENDILLTATGPQVLTHSRIIRL